jgi:DNA-binding transcriptional ArsR family regulator
VGEPGLILARSVISLTRPVSEVERRPPPKDTNRDGLRATCGPDEHSRRDGTRVPLSDEAFWRAASFFRTLGDVARLKLLDRLAEGEWCVTELAEAADVGLSTVSQQLRALRAEHLVVRRRTGKHIYYSLADRHVLELVANALAHAVEDRTEADEDDETE